MLGLAQRRLLADRPRPGRPPAPGAPAPALPALDGAARARRRARARWAPRSPAPGPAVLFWCHWQQTGDLMERAARGGAGLRRAPGAVRARRRRREGAVSEEVEAAGGVVVRDDGPRVPWCTGPSYDDWTLPKGKLDPGESFEEAALREVEEETGPALRARARAAEHRLPRQQGPARSSCATGRWRSPRRRVRAQRRGGRAALADAGGGRASCSPTSATASCWQSLASPGSPEQPLARRRASLVRRRSARPTSRTLPPRTLNTSVAALPRRRYQRFLPIRAAPGAGRGGGAACACRVPTRALRAR